MTTDNAAPQPTFLEIPPEGQSAICEELSVLERTQSSLDGQLRSETVKLGRERNRSRELTSGLVATRRDEDRYLLASDEAVSHQLSAQHEDAVETLVTLMKKPYFARVVLEEEDDTGNERTIEYKIGYAANPACRIVDWRRAPLSRLYYEYREGDEYCEEIQGRERSGRVTLRNTVEIEEGQLKQLTCRHGAFRSDENTWTVAGRGRSKGRDFGALPEVLSLITAEQFRTITRSSDEPILVQGVAGSGKTTVALHRLAWLLEKGNSDLAPRDALVITLGPSLREYIRKSLSQLGIADTPVFSYRIWCGRQIASSLPASLLGSDGNLSLTPSSSKPPSGVERVKRSVALLKTIEELGKEPTAPRDPLALLISALQQPKTIVRFDETKLLNESLIRESLLRTQQIVQRGTLDRSDFALLLRCAQVLRGPVVVAGRSDPYRHVLIDEVQDYSPVELATLLSTVRAMGDLTLVGDTNQQVEDGFPGWTKLQRWWGTRKLDTSLVKLQVSHRSTREIMGCASTIAKNENFVGGRSGKKPIWMFAADQERSIGALISWLQEIATETPTALVGVLCFSAAAAREIFALLSPSLGATVRLVDESSFTFEEGIIVADAHLVRGLEFFAVSVVQPLSAHLPPGAAGRNLLYIATTRAQERLCYLTWGRGPSPLSDVPERFLERIDLDEQEEDEVEMEELDLLG